MALSVSGFDPSLDYKIIYQSVAVNSANVDVAQGPCSLISAVIDNGSGTADCFLKLFDGDSATVGTSIPNLIFRCKQETAQRFEVPEGVSFTNLSFWVTRNAADLDNTVPTVSGGNVLVTLVVKPSCPWPSLRAQRLPLWRER